MLFLYDLKSCYKKTTELLFTFGAFAQTPNFDGIVDEDE